MKKLLFIPFCLLLASCVDHNDFSFSGTVVDYEMCNGIYDVGYAICLTSPTDIGGSYTTQYDEVYDNVVVVYGSDRILQEGAHVSGRIYLDHNYSKTSCNYHYYDRDVPEAVFTKLKTD